MPKVVSLHADWQALLNVSDRMLELAHKEDWLSLAEEDLQRQPLLKKYFSSENNKVSDIIQTERVLQLQGIEEQLLSLCVTERTRTAKELHDIHLGKTADKAYSNHA